jgi:hypothetical protein
MKPETIIGHPNQWQQEQKSLAGQQIRNAYVVNTWTAFPTFEQKTTETKANEKVQNLHIGNTLLNT